MRILVFGLLLAFSACRPNSTNPPAPPAASPIYWIGWSDRPDRHRDNLSFRQRALHLRRHTGGPLLIARNGQQALQLLHTEVAYSTAPRPLVFLGHGDGFGLFMAERNGIYRDTIRTRADLALKYGGGPRQNFFSALPSDSLLIEGISEALFLSCYSAGVAQEWVRRTGQPAIGALHLVHPVLNADSTQETGTFRCDLPFVRYRKGKSGVLADTLGRQFDPLQYWESKTQHPQNTGLSLGSAHVQKPDPGGQVAYR